jgi:O-antigen/teichoic acid export membrane protein
VSRDAAADHGGEVAFPWPPDSAGASRGRLRRVGSAAIAGVFAKVVVVACNLALVPVLVGFLGPVQFGIWAAYQSIQGLLVFADFGIGNGMQNAVTVAIAHGDTRRAQALISSALVALLAAAGVLGALVAVGFNVPSVVAWLSGGRPDDAELAALRVGVAVFIATGLLAIPLSCGDRLALAMQEGFVTNATRAITTIMSFGCVIALVRANASFAAICIATSIPVLAGPLLSWMVVARGRSWASPAISAVSGGDIRAVLRSGIGFLAVQLTAILGFGLDAILIERYAGPVEVANYAVVQRLFGLVAMVVGIFLAPLWPAYADARARGDYAWIRTTFLRSLVATAVVAGVLSIVLAVLAGPIAARWVGNAIDPPASLVTAFAAWSFVLACGMAFSYFWNGMHMLRLQAVLGGMFVLVGLPVKIAALQSGSATSVVLINAITYFATALLPGAIVTWMAIRAAAPSTGGGAARRPTA